MSENDRQIARRASEFQSRAKDFRLIDHSSYVAWSKRKLSEGESEAVIAHLDATGVSLLPEDAATMTEVEYEDMLDDLKLGLNAGPHV
jgi:hypothetical protein